MWSLVISFLTKTVLTKLTSVFTSAPWLKWILVAIPIVILGFMLAKSKWDYADLKEKYDGQQKQIETLSADLNAAKHTIGGLNAGIELSDKQKLDANELLKECHESLDRYQVGFQQIGSNMSADPTGLPVNKDEKGEQRYEPVTQKQNAAGIDFLNTQLGIVK